MPVPGFLQSFADKAQSAINASPLGSLTQQNPGGSASNRSHTIESFSNQLRVISQQYSYVHRVGRDAQYQSKELFTWGKNESDDLKDGNGTLVRYLI